MFSAATPACAHSLLSVTLLRSRTQRSGAASQTAAKFVKSLNSMHNDLNAIMAAAEPAFLYPVTHCLLRGLVWIIVCCFACRSCLWLPVIMCACVGRCLPAMPPTLAMFAMPTVRSVSHAQTLTLSICAIHCLQVQRNALDQFFAASLDYVKNTVMSPLKQTRLVAEVRSLIGIASILLASP